MAKMNCQIKEVLYHSMSRVPNIKGSSA